jgi:DNA-binding NtrC family response regulator
VNSGTFSPAVEKAETTKKGAMSSHILVIDDEKNYLLILETILQDAGFTVTTLNDPELAVAFLEESEVDVIITDMKMPKMSGQEILENARRRYPYIPVIIMTAYGSIDSAVEAMRCGAFDYIAKPFSNDELLLSVSKADQLAKAEQRNRILRQNLEERYGRHQIIGRSKPMHQVLDMVDRVAPTRSTVLITGESGSGKELIARAIHFSSGRKDGPFISVNCMALNPGTWRANSSATRRAPSPEQWPGRRAVSNWPTGAPCSWTRSANSAMTSRSSSCASCRNAPLSGSAEPSPSTWICG